METLILKIIISFACGVALSVFALPFSSMIFTATESVAAKEYVHKTAFWIGFIIGLLDLWVLAVELFQHKRAAKVLFGSWCAALCISVLQIWHSDHIKENNHILGGHGTEKAYNECCRQIPIILRIPPEMVSCASWYDVLPAPKAPDSSPQKKLIYGIGNDRIRKVSFSSWVDVRNEGGGVQRRKWTAVTTVFLTGELWGNPPPGLSIQVDELSIK